MWQETGRVDPIHDGRWDGIFVCMCTTMFKREDSWKSAFPLQLAVALMFAPRVKICLVTFAADAEAWAYCFKHAQWALDLGILYLASAGDMAGEAVPSSERQRYWHASQCKNAAHTLAARETWMQGIAPQNVVLVNVDVDNIVPPSYLEALLAGWEAELQRMDEAGLSDETTPGRPLMARCAHGPLTGRIALSLPDFARLGGYDEEPKIYGTGSQDVDLLDRAKAMFKQWQEHAMETHQGLPEGASFASVPPVRMLPCEAGAAFDNEPNLTVKEDRGSSKIKNLDPEVVQAFKTWGRVNNANWAQFTEKMKQGRLGRNGVDASPNLDQPAQWHVDNFLRLRLGSQFHRHPSPAVPWDTRNLCEHLRQQQVRQVRELLSPAALPNERGSVGSATELVENSSSSRAIFVEDDEPPPFPPRSKARPAEKPTAKAAC
jgi:hypothetical protein